MSKPNLSHVFQNALNLSPEAGRRKQWIGLALGGAMMGIAPVNAWPLAWVALVPLWVTVRAAINQLALSPQAKGALANKDALKPTLKSALLYAAVWGAAYHGTALSWVWGIHPMTWLGVPWLWSLTITLLSWLFITAWGAAIAMTWSAAMVAVNRGRQLTAVQQIFVGTALWCAVEWVWSRGPLYWTALSYTQSPHNLLALHLGQLAGPSTVTAGIVAVNGLLAVAVGQGKAATQATGSPPLTIWPRSQSRYLVGAIALWLALQGIGFGLYVRPLADQPAAVMPVGLIQGNLPTAYKMTAPGIQASRRVYLEGYEALVNEGAGLVITPEGSIPETWNAFLQERNVMMRAVAKHQVPLLLGTFAHKAISDTGSPLAQSLLTLVAEPPRARGKAQADSQPRPDTGTSTALIAGRYNKVKLVPLGEYMPLEKWLGWLSPFGSSLSPGTFDQLLETPFGSMAAGICYESAFSELFRQQVKRGGLAIFTASNNDPYPPWQMMQHHGQDVMRAIEGDRWMVRVTNTGISAVVTPHGQTLWQSAAGEYATHLENIYRRNTQTPYVRFGDWLTPLLVALAAGVCLWR